MSIDWSAFLFGKRTRAERMRDEDAQWKARTAIIAAVRADVFQLDTVCAACGGRPRQTDELHEVVSRAKTRGLPPEERFNRKICVRLHRRCHQATTANEILMACLDAETGVDGGLVVQRRGSDEAVVYRRGAKPSHRGAGLGTVRRGQWTAAGDVGRADALRDAQARPPDQLVRRSS